MSRIRLSYSILNAWSRGDYENALNMYFRKPTPTTPAMELGKKYHCEWENYIIKNQRIPKIFGHDKLNNPQPEVKIEKDLNDWLQIVGVIDLYEPDTLTGRDWKSGTTEVNQYANGYQHKFYQILIPKMQQFYYHSFNPYNNEVSTAKIYLTNNTLQDGVEWVVTFASEIKNYLEENKYV